MIVSLFKTNQVVGLIFLLLFQVLIYLNAFVHLPPATFTPVETPVLYRLVIDSWINFSRLSVVLSFVFITSQALLFNSFMIKTGILGKPTYLPAFFFVLVCSLLPENLYTNPATIANFFVLPSFMCIWEIARKSASVPAIFTGAFLLSIGSLLYPPVIVLVIWFWVSLIVISGVGLKKVAVLLISFCLPYLYTFTAYFWFSSPKAFLTDFFITPFGFPDYRLGFRITEYVLYAVIVLALGLSFSYYLMTIHSYKIIQKKMFQVCGYFLVAIILSGTFYHLFQKHHLVLLGFSMSVFLSFYFLQLKKGWIADLIILSILALVIILQVDFY